MKNQNDTDGKNNGLIPETR